MTSTAFPIHGRLRLAALRQSVRSLLFNPVVVRDLRAQMRGTKSYWFQGAYLLLLGTLAVTGYTLSTGQSLMPRSEDAARSTLSIVEAQSQLQGFYYFTFGTLAALICLIAPALTAASIVGERQRLSLDLLVTTPLTAGELLTGKLVSSVAFLGLLLTLSLPASALCVLLGGATLGDVFRTYLLLAIGGVTLASIGLFFSCAARTTLLAVIWSYVTVGIVVFGTFCLFGSGVRGGNFTDPGAVSPFTALLALNPFVAILPRAAQSVPFGAFAVPVWVLTAGFAALIVRLMITASAYRLGVYGGSAASSLRRQTIFLLGLLALVASQGMLQASPLGDDSTYGYGYGHGMRLGGTLAAALLVAFLGMTPFLPGLFVPAAAPEDAPPGGVEETGVWETNADSRAYRLSRVFRPVHAGALPLFHLCLLAVFGGAMTGAFIAVRGSVVPLERYLETVLLLAITALYLAGLGLLFWQLARLAACLVRRVSGARALAFGLFALLAALPIMGLALISNNSQNSSWEDHILGCLWLLRPLFKLGQPQEIVALMAFPTAQAYVLGGIVGLIRGMLIRKADRRAAG
ncbi:MAG: ABC transporter permease subunit [Cytophagales bacterium]|nr:ABC transporter permease subunit [Armatimonadota bacterium]